MTELRKKFFTRENFSMQHENPTVFVTSQWQRKVAPCAWYLAYRIVLALFVIVSWILSIADLRFPNQSASQRAKWLIYLTSWGYTLIMIQAVLAATMTIQFFLARRRREAIGQTQTIDGETNNFQLYKPYWTINVMATDLAFGITIIYWSLVYDAKKMPLDAMNIIVHILNSLIMLTDACITAHPVRPLHCYWPLLLGVLYAIFTAIYYLAGGVNKEGMTCIYKILDWSKPDQALITCAGVTIFLVLIHICYYGLYRLRLKVHTIMRARHHMKEKHSSKTWYDNNALAAELT